MRTLADTEGTLPSPMPSAPAVLAAGLGLAGACVVGWATAPYGIGLGPDPIGYVSVAQSAVDGEGFVRYDGEPHIVQPLFYPALLAATAMVSSGDVLQVSRWVALFIFGALVGVSGWLASDRLWGAALVAGAAVLASPPLAKLAGTAFSETLFCLLTLSALGAAAHYLRRPTLAAVWGMIVLAGAATLTRYVGVVAVVAVGLTVLASPGPLIRRVRHFALVLTGTGLMVGLNLFRNAVLADSAVGARLPALFSGWQVIEAYATIITRWFGLPLVDADAVLVLVLLSVAFVAGVSYTVFRLGRASFAVPLLPYGLFIGGYFVFMVWASSSVMFDRPSDRFMAPLFAPLVVVAVRTGAAAWRRWPHHPVRLALALAAVLLVGVFARQSVNAWTDQRINGYFFDGPVWRSSEVLTYACSLPGSSGRLLSNAPEALYVRCGLEARRSPAERLTRAVSPPELSGLMEGTLLVWIDSVSRAYLYTPEALQSHVPATRLANLADGAVYRFDE